MNIRFAAASLLLVAGLSGCAANSAASAPSTASTPSATSTPTPSATPTTATPSAQAVKTSGSYAADVTALGIKPDSMTEYTAYLKERICGQSGTGLGVSVRSIGGGTPASGGGQDVVRLTVAYFCPSKSAEVEKFLEYFS